MIITLVEDKQTIALSEKDRPKKGGETNNQNWKGKKNKCGKKYVRCCNIGVDGGIYRDYTAIKDWNYGMGPIDRYGSVGGRVCGRNQNILKFFLNFSQL